jgi:hypothetical protein
MLAEAIDKISNSLEKEKDDFVNRIKKNEIVLNGLLFSDYKDLEYKSSIIELVLEGLRNLDNPILDRKEKISMNIKHNISRDFVYIPYDHKLRDTKTNEEKEDDQNISNELHNEILKTRAREIIKERTPTLEVVESTLHELIRRKKLENNIPYVDQYNTNRYESNVKKTEEKKQVPVITRLIKKGYLKDSKKWLSSKGFTIIGGKILQDVLNELKNEIRLT